MRNTVCVVINAILQMNEDIHYYQGFSDIIIVLLIVMGERDAFQIGRKIVRSHLADFMTPTLHPAMDMLAVSLIYIYVCL